MCPAVRTRFGAMRLPLPISSPPGPPVGLGKDVWRNAIHGNLLASEGRTSVSVIGGILRRNGCGNSPFGPGTLRYLRSNGVSRMIGRDGKDARPHPARPTTAVSAPYSR